MQARLTTGCAGDEGLEREGRGERGEPDCGAVRGLVQTDGCRQEVGVVHEHVRRGCLEPARDKTRGHPVEFVALPRDADGPALSLA